MIFIWDGRGGWGVGGMSEKDEEIKKHKCPVIKSQECKYSIGNIVIIL